LLSGRVAELLGGTEPGYDMDEIVGLPGFTGAGFVYDESNKLPGRAAYPLEKPMKLGSVDETG
jgi:hypothetical protein